MGNKMYILGGKKDQLVFQEPVLIDKKGNTLLLSFFFKAADFNRKQHTLLKVHLHTSLVAQSQASKKQTQFC